MGCVAAACGGGGGGPAEGVATMCGANLCVSIAENPELAEAGGGLIFKQASGHTIYVVRTGASTFSVVTAICTHSNCTIEWNGSNSFDCPCHGSKFSPDGQATLGPAFRPLRVYTHMLDADTLTIVL
jgi:Rieske Fe-S protein